MTLQPTTADDLDHAEAVVAELLDERSRGGLREDAMLVIAAALRDARSRAAAAEREACARQLEGMSACAEAADVNAQAALRFILRQAAAALRARGG